MHGHFHTAVKFTFISREGTSYFNEWEAHFHWGFIFRGTGHPTGVESASMRWGGGGGVGKKNLWSRRHPKHGSLH